MTPEQERLLENTVSRLISKIDQETALLAEVLLRMDPTALDELRGLVMSGELGRLQTMPDAMKLLVARLACLGFVVAMKSAGDRLAVELVENL